MELAAHARTSVQASHLPPPMGSARARWSSGTVPSHGPEDSPVVEAARLRLDSGRGRVPPEGGMSQGRMGNSPLHLSTRVMQWVSSPASSTASAWGD